MLEIGNWVDAEQSTGRVIHIPNSRVFTATIANYTAGFEYIWNELSVTVTFESDWRKAKRMVESIAMTHCAETAERARRAIERAGRSQMIVFSKFGPRVWTSVADSGVVLSLRYLCGPRERRGTSEAIWEQILDEFAGAPDVDFAYPTIRHFLNKQEGKPEAGGPGQVAQLEGHAPGV